MARRSSRPLPEREWHSPPEIAARIGKRPEYIVAEIQAGRLPAGDFASAGASRPRYRIHRDDLEGWIERRRVVPPAKPVPLRPRTPAGVREYV